MKYYELDEEEKQLLEEIDKGEWKPVKNLERAKAYFRRVAAETLKKDRRINIRLSQKDLMGIQARAAREGMPYQTLISSIIHQFVVGNIRGA